MVSSGNGFVLELKILQLKYLQTCDAFQEYSIAILKNRLSGSEMTYCIVIHQSYPFSPTIRLVLKSILSLFLLRYVYAAPGMIISRQDLGAENFSVKLPSSLDEKTNELPTK